jgi:hypothetical protein
MNMAKISLTLSLALITTSLFSDDIQWQRTSPQKGVDIMNALNPNLFPDYPRKDDDHVYFAFQDAGRWGKAFFNIKENGGKFEADYTISAKNSEDGNPIPAKIEGRIIPEGSRKILYNFKIEPEKGRKSKDLFFGMTLSKNIFDRKIVFNSRNADGSVHADLASIPAQKDGGGVYESGKQHLCEEIRIPMIHGDLRISGFSAPVLAMKYGPDMANIRIYPAYSGEGPLSVSFTIEFLDRKTLSLDISKAANMGFADEVENDGKGGWTDQGPENDMHVIPLGSSHFGNIEFNIIDPAKNGGKSCLVFANKTRPEMLKDATIEVGGKTFDYLYLLHGTAWTQLDKKIGTIAIEYVDGSSKNLDVVAGRDVGDWWNPERGENALVIFRAKNGSNEVGLYMSRFKLDGKPVGKVVFKTAGNSVWMIAAASGVSGGDIPFLSDEAELPCDFKVGNDWRAIRYFRDVEPGSALDFSFIPETGPAGKHGRVVIRDGRFEFEKLPGKPARFSGVNICQDAAVMLDKELAIWPERFRRMGYNAIRLQAFDDRVVKNVSALEFDDDALNNFFKTFAKFKEKGFYINLSLFIGRLQGFNKTGYNHETMKIIIVFDRESRENLKGFTKKILTTENPCTGMSIASDPALLSIAILNELFLFSGGDPALEYPNQDPFLNEIYTKSFIAWCEERNLDPAKRDASMWSRFLMDAHREFYADFKAFLRELGIKVPITNIDGGSLIMDPVRLDYDYVDRHTYFDHPSFPKKRWSYPFEYSDESAASSFYKDFLCVPANRIFGKPLTVTEYHFCAPNSFRAEAGPIIGALSALQGFDGIFDFSPLEYLREWKSLDPVASESGRMGTFSSVSDPIAGLSSRIVTAYFLRGDVAPAKESFTLNVPEDIYTRDYANEYRNWKPCADPPGEFQRLGLVARTGIAVTSEKGDMKRSFTTDQLRDGKSQDLNRLLANSGRISNGKITSVDGQIEFNTTGGPFIVSTPKSESITLSGKDGKASVLSVSDCSTFSTIFACALDEQELVKSKRILILHLTDVKNENCNYVKWRGKLRDYGGGKSLLLRKGTAVVSLKSNADGRAVLYAIDITGKRLGEVPFKDVDGILEFNINNGAGDVPSVGYEVTRQ